VLQWARDNGCPWTEWTCAYAAKGGHLEVLKWGAPTAVPGTSRHVRLRRAKAISRCCSGRGPTAVHGTSRRAAAEGGHLDVLQWERANGCSWVQSTCEVAAKGGHLEVLKWARANGCPWDEWTCAYAAEGGHLDVLRWARGLPMGPVDMFCCC
jgi:hypothetical protein